MLRVLKCSGAEPENLSKTSGSKPEVAVKSVIALSIFTYWKNASMKNASFDSKPEKKLSEHLA